MKRDSTERREETLKAILGDLGREHRSVEAPAHLERLLGLDVERVAGSARRAQVRRNWAWGVGLALAACVLLSVIAWRAGHGHSGTMQQVQVVPHQAQTPLRALNSDPTSQKRRVERPRHTPPRTPLSPEETSFADFVPLPASEGLPTASEISLVRMRIQGSALQQYGLEIPPEAGPRALLAEFAVGEDGLPRAIRIVQ